MKGYSLFVILLCVLGMACQPEPGNEGSYYDEKKEYSAISDHIIDPQQLVHKDTLASFPNKNDIDSDPTPGTSTGQPSPLTDKHTQPVHSNTAISNTLSVTDESAVQSAPDTGRPNTTRPNIVIILADDLDDIFTPPYFPEVLPIVDSLKKHGIDFTHSFTPMSICCPSRAASLTGMYAHQNGVYRNVSTNGGWEYFRPNEPYTLPAYLSRSGYRTTMIGKYLNGYSIEEADGELLPPYGWTDGTVFVNFFFYPGYDYDLMFWDHGVPVNDTAWKVDNRKVTHYDAEPEDYSTDVLTREALLFLQQSEEKDDQPFFMFLCPTAPHWPLQPAPRYLEKTNKRWTNDTVPVRPNTVNDYGKLATAAEKKIPLDKSSWLRDTWKKRVRQMERGAWYYNQLFDGRVPRPINSFLQAEWYSRMGSLYALNDMLGDVISGLKEQGEWDNTLLIFTSDNGYMLGAHALMHKGNPYEESIRVPMVITGGDSLHLKTPGKIQEWVTNLDLMPTILELAGIKIPENTEGLSLVPLLTSDSITNFRESFVMEYLGPGMAVAKFADHPKWIMKRLPLYILDHPSYNAIRMKTGTAGSGEKTEKVYKYIEWQRYWDKKTLRFSDQYRLKDPRLMAKLRSGNKKAWRLKARSEEVETELYDLTVDPYEMDNLLYYKPEEYRDLAATLKDAMRSIILKNDPKNK